MYTEGSTTRCANRILRSNVFVTTLSLCSFVFPEIKKISYPNGKAIPETGREGPQGYETSRLPHFLENRLTDGGEVVSLTRRQPFTPRKIFLGLISAIG
jgi:hypothetical protein